MFTGLIETTGIIKQIKKQEMSIILGVKTDLNDTNIAAGDSVSVNGICLTLESIQGNMLFFTAVWETCKKTTLPDMRPGDTVNLERALSLSGRIEGHFVLGHVDGTGTIVNDQPTGVSLLRTIRVPGHLMPFLAPKGSVAIDGVSLTIADTNKEEITISLVPYTLEKTTMKTLKPGKKVNVECDVLARYILNLHKYGDLSVGLEKGLTTLDKKQNDNLLSTMEKIGF